MYDNNNIFGTIALAGASSAADTVVSAIKDMAESAKIEQYTPYAFVFVPESDVAGTVTIEVQEADAVSGSEDSVTLTSPTSQLKFTITNPEAGKEYRFPFPFGHKRYIALSASAEVTVNIFAAVERLIW